MVMHDEQSERRHSRRISMQGKQVSSQSPEPAVASPTPESLYQRLMIVGLLAGLFFCAAGMVLFILGISGVMDIGLEGTGFKVKLANASPGAFLALLGAAIIWRYRPHVKTSSHKTKDSERTDIILFSHNCSQPALERRMIGNAVHIPDARLRARLLAEFGRSQGQVGDLELQSLVGLNLNDQSVTDLTGIECCTNLEILALERNSQLIDISPLAHLTKLKTLSLNATAVTDISAVANMTDLEYLYIGAMNLPDLQPIRDLSNIKEMSLAFSTVKDLEPLLKSKMQGRLKNTNVVLWGLRYPPNQHGLYIALGGTS